MPVNRSFLALGLAVICALCLMGLPQSQKNNIAQFSRSGLLAAGQRLFFSGNSLLLERGEDEIPADAKRRTGPR